MNRLIATPRVLRMIFSVLLSLAMTACATLPDLAYLNKLEPTSSATVSNGKNVLSEKKSAAFLSKRLRSSKVDLKRLAALEEEVTGYPLISGNKVTLLFDGPQTLGAMMAAVRNAKDSVNLETYIFDQDELGLQFADLLIEKQKSGVQVNVLYDSVGTLGTPKEFFQKMRDAGINLTEFNPANPLNAKTGWHINNRDHRKILIVDGTIGFAGGVNIAGDYANSSLFRSGGRRNVELGWRDTHLQIEGPAVASLQLLFLNAWTSQNSIEVADRDYFPTLAPAGDKIVRILPTAPKGDFEIYRAYVLAIQNAKSSIHITNAYFAPDVQLLTALTDATQRGVDVKMVFPSISDAGLVYHAGRSFYTTLLDAGVKIFELKASVLHAKTGVIDSAWSTVGSANLDMRSFLHNSEINVVVLGDPFGREMESAFNEDLKNSNQITKEQWDQRPISDRMKEWAARNFEYWL